MVVLSIAQLVWAVFNSSELLWLHISSCQMKCSLHTSTLHCASLGDFTGLHYTPTSSSPHNNKGTEEMMSFVPLFNYESCAKPAMYGKYSPLRHSCQLNVPALK